MGTSHWNAIYRENIMAPAEQLFELTSDLPNYGRWLPQSGQFGGTTDVEPYPVRLGSRYHDGRPGSEGRSWWGEVVGFAPPRSIDFHHTIHVREARARVEVHIHYAFEPAEASTDVIRWLLLEFSMPFLTRPLRRLITASFDKENVRTLAALKQHAELGG